MIRMIQSTSAAHAKAYFSDALLKSDYYLSDQELAGVWQGRLAERLGLNGIVDKDSFFAMAENLHPLTGEHLTARTKEERRTGYDINFHCPKSVSVLHALSKDNHILKAFLDSVTETMQHIEADTLARVRKGGAYANRPTGELAWAHFVHQTARPVEGFLPDPHLHSHCFVFNATWDSVEKEFKAGEFGDIKRDMPYYQARFHKVFSDKLIDLGYQVRQTDKSFEVENVPKQVIDLFSKRTDEIGRVAREKGITDAKELAELGARTRAKKDKAVSMSELKDSWRQQIKDLGTEGRGETEKTVRFAPTKEASTLTPQACVDYAISHSFERASVMADRRLLETAFRHGLGVKAVSVQSISEKFKADDRIIHVKDKSRTLCTTKEVLKEEKRMVDLAKQGQGKMKPLYDKAPELKLKGQQAAAVEHILTTPHRVSIVKGGAGTGKTTLMNEAVEKIQKAGKEVTVLAPSAEASRGVLKSEGFENAETVARFLVSPKMQEKTKGQVLWVDEAGLLGTKDMAAIFEIATKNNARVILGGDTRQHASVVRGDALRIVSTAAGIKSAEVSKVYRQKNEDLKMVVEDLAKGDIKRGFEKLDKMKGIKTIDPLNPTQLLTSDYMAARKKHKETLIISPTHSQGEAITKDIRASLKEAGLVGKKEVTAKRLINLNLTEAEKSDARNYEEGQVVQFVQNVRGFPRGSVWMVEKTSEKDVQVKNEKGDLQLLPLDKGNRFQVYEQSELQLSKGDRVKVTTGATDKNGKRLDNGSLLEVTSVSKQGDVKLKKVKGKSTYTLSKDFGHLSHAYVLTSYAAQGKGVDQVFIYQPSATFPATDAKQFYVSVSRGKDAAFVYTDDKKELLRHATDLRERKSALELTGHGKASQDFKLQLQQNEKPKEKSSTIQKVNPKETHAPEI
ncbi:MAG: Flp pilus assembly complex ATPase component TadA [Bacteroidetes bacterium]|nr:Flp pilus assembly complex ATPase component TadA [Bacteroidota bacterium]